MPSIYIVGEAYGTEEARFGRPFVGPSGHVLDSLLRDHGLSRDDVTLDNVFPFRPVNGDIDTLMTREPFCAATEYGPFKPKVYLHKDYSEFVRDLRVRVRDAAPNVVLALGNVALWALAGVSGIKKWRGSPMLCSFAPIKLLATFNPAAILRAWDDRPIAFMDFAKAIRQSAFPDLRRPHRFIHYAPTLAEIEAFYHEYIVPAPWVAADIETKNHSITEIGFAPSAERCLVIPFWSRASKDGNYWPSAAEERVAWNWTRRILAEKSVVGQNWQYDMQYLWRTAGIPSPRVRGDTMLLHHSLQPELQKGLGFLGSVYTDEGAWKFMRHDNDSYKKGE